MAEQVVFFGTGEVAARSLQLLVETFTIEAVVTKPRPAHHRGPWPVTELAEQLGVPVIEAVNKNAVTHAVATGGLTSQVGILIDFGIIVEQQVIDSFPKGIINSHFSLLPEWRGADPITFSILSGQDKTGVSLMLLVEKMDEGPLLAVGEADIDLHTTNTPELTSSLIGLSYALLRDMVPRYLNGELQPTPQEELAQKLGRSPLPSYSHKLAKEDGILDWNKPAAQLEREIRAYKEWPKSRCLLNNYAVIVTEATVVQRDAPTPGTLVVDAKHLYMGTGEDWLEITRLKPAGKQEMTAEAFLNGYHL